LGKHWKSGSIGNKQKIQKLVFPEGFVINPKNRQYRTSKINSVFKTIRVISRDKKGKTKNAPSVLDNALSLVAGAGLTLSLRSFVGNERSGFTRKTINALHLFIYFF